MRKLENERIRKLENWKIRELGNEKISKWGASHTDDRSTGGGEKLAD